MTYREIETTLGISRTSIHSILREPLTVKKICSLWISHNFSIVQKQDCVDWSKEMLEKYDRGASKYVYDIVIGDESWIYVYEPESKQQSTVWVFQVDPTPTKVAYARITSKKMMKLKYRSDRFNNARKMPSETSEIILYAQKSQNLQVCVFYIIATDVEKKVSRVAYGFLKLTTLQH